MLFPGLACPVSHISDFTPHSESKAFGVFKQASTWELQNRLKINPNYAWGGDTAWYSDLSEASSQDTLISLFQNKK